MVVAVNLNQKRPNAHVIPVADNTDWVALCTDPKTADTANLLKPSAVTRTTQFEGRSAYASTTVQVCLRYETGEAVTTAPAIKLVGIDGNGVPQLLEDVDGNTAFTLSVDTAADLQDADGNSYTDFVEVDMNNNKALMALIVTALVGGGTVGGDNGPQIMARVK